MTECIKQSIRFSSLKSKKILADFNGGFLTSDAGALLLREIDKHLGIIDAVNRCIPDPRNQFFIAHLPRNRWMAKRIYKIVLSPKAIWPC